MLSSAPIVETVADFLSSHGKVPLVVDPVMVATSGAVLLEEDAIQSYKEKLIPSPPDYPQYSGGRGAVGAFHSE